MDIMPFGRSEWTLDPVKYATPNAAEDRPKWLKSSRIGSEIWTIGSTGDRRGGRPFLVTTKTYIINNRELKQRLVFRGDKF